VLYFTTFIVYPPKTINNKDLVYQLITPYNHHQNNPPHSQLQNTLSTNNITRTNLTLNPPGRRSPNRNSQRLERTLRPVVVIITISAANMQCHIGSLRKALQTVGDHLRAKITDLLALEAEVDHGPGTGGQIDDGPGEGFVEGGIATAEAGEGLAGAEGFCEGCAEGEESIFRCVVVVDWKGS
jgi:hypothetical protein